MDESEFDGCFRAATWGVFCAAAYHLVLGLLSGGRLIVWEGIWFGYGLSIVTAVLSTRVVARLGGPAKLLFLTAGLGLAASLSHHLDDIVICVLMVGGACGGRLIVDLFAPRRRWVDRQLLACIAAALLFVVVMLLNPSRRSADQMLLMGLGALMLGLSSVPPRSWRADVRP